MHLTLIALTSLAADAIDLRVLQRLDLSIREPAMNVTPMVTAALVVMVMPAERRDLSSLAVLLVAAPIAWGVADMRRVR